MKNIIVVILLLFSLKIAAQPGQDSLLNVIKNLKEEAIQYQIKESALLDLLSNCSNAEVGLTRFTEKSISVVVSSSNNDKEYAEYEFSDLNTLLNEGYFIHNVLNSEPMPNQKDKLSYLVLTFILRKNE